MCIYLFFLCAFTKFYTCRAALHLSDTKDKFLALLLTHMPTCIPQAFETLSNRLLAHFHNEIWDENSNRPKYNYLAIHYHWWNRYAEQVSEFVSI